MGEGEAVHRNSALPNWTIQILYATLARNQTVFANVIY